MMLERTMLAYVAAYGFVVGIVLGALALVMTLHLTNARWAAAISRCSCA